jgi:hypothetical protein
VCVCDVRGAVWCRLGSVALEDLEKKNRCSGASPYLRAASSPPSVEQQ